MNRPSVGVLCLRVLASKSNIKHPTFWEENRTEQNKTVLWQFSIMSLTNYLDQWYYLFNLSCSILYLEVRTLFVLSQELHSMSKLPPQEAGQGFTALLQTAFFLNQCKCLFSYSKAEERRKRVGSWKDFWAAKWKERVEILALWLH